MSGHTPGPWKVRRNESTNKPACEITTQDKKSICYMSNGDLGLSNARLISTAPDLLEEIENIVPKETFHTSKEWEDNDGYGYEVILSVGDIKRLRSLIAKAKGGA